MADEKHNTRAGFAIPLQPHTDLGLAMLIAEDEDGQHEALAVVGSINEARETAETDFHARMARMEGGGDAASAQPLQALGPRHRWHLPNRLRTYRYRLSASFPPIQCAPPGNGRRFSFSLLYAQPMFRQDTWSLKPGTGWAIAFRANVGQLWRNSGQPSASLE